MPRGCYIVFEGVVGTGKTTQSKRLVDDLKQRYPEREIIWTREPGGDEVAEAIRLLAQGPSLAEKMDPICEAYLFAAARAQSLRTVVRPAVERGALVIADRNVMSSIAFQGFGRELGVETVLAINQIAIEACRPDFILYLEAPPEVAMMRAQDKLGDKFESLDASFFTKVAKGYHTMSQHPWTKDIWHTIDANVSIDEVYRRIVEVVKPCL